MKLALLSYGTRGDVQPFLALAWALKARGHQVRLLVPDNFIPVTARAGITPVALGIDADAEMRSERALRVLARGDVLSFSRLMVNCDRTHDAAICRGVTTACEGVDGIISGALASERAFVMAEVRRIPVAVVHMFPIIPSGSFPPALVTTANIRTAWLNRLLHRFSVRLLLRFFRSGLDAYRATHGLLPYRGNTVEGSQRLGALCLHNYSPAIFPRPADWGANNLLTGFWDVPAGLRTALGEERIDPALEAWLEAGPAPVFFGFGSMPVLEPERFLDQIRAVVRMTGIRALIGAGWSRFTQAGDDKVYIAPAFDHARILPRCIAAIHHGGAGTTYASLRAGLPTHVCSVLGDQPFWGHRCVTLGVGSTFPFSRLTEQRLARAIDGLLRPQLRSAAQALGERLRSENGLEAAINAIEERLPSSPIPW